MPDIEWNTALKWILTILITGFIAQFGRMFAEYLIKKLKKPDIPSSSDTSPAEPLTDQTIPATAILMKDDKREKKIKKGILKDEKKRFKSLKKS